MAREKKLKVFSFFPNLGVNACAYMRYVKTDDIPESYRYGGSNQCRSSLSQEDYAKVIPKFIKSDRSVKKLAEVFGSATSIEVVSEKFKSIIETLEPNIHQFSPITVLNYKDEPWEGNYYSLRVMTYLTALHVDKSGVIWTKQHDGMYGLAIDNPREYYFNLARVKGYHLWQHEPYVIPGLLCSREFRAACLEAKIPSLCWMKTQHHVVDEPWTDFGNTQPKDAYDPKISKRDRLVRDTSLNSIQ